MRDGDDGAGDGVSRRLTGRLACWAAKAVGVAFLSLCTGPPVHARINQGFVCAGHASGSPPAKPTQSRPRDVRAEGRTNILVVFAKFGGEHPQETTAPAWADGLFDVDRPGSVSHFYETMSGGRFTVDGVVAPGYYEAPLRASAYLAESSNERGGYPAFSHEILALVDADVDFGDFNNDGADGVASSRDDDRFVDIVFIVLNDVPERFLAGPATGIFGLGRYPNYVTSDGRGSQSLLVPSERISVLQGASHAEAAGILSHEFAHLLGVPDLFNIDFVYTEGARPVVDSAGIGAWGLMGWGALGWSGNDGPNSFCAWTLLELGWVEAIRPTSRDHGMRLGALTESRQVYEILMPNQERFLIANRQREANHYDRHLPGEGLLIWHEDPGGGDVVLDLECADGKWVGAGYPMGEKEDAAGGGDNLDFWAHDAQYAEDHGGNVGDSTDPFDGVRYRRFGPDTNPDSYNNTRKWSPSIEDISFDTDGTATARTRPVPLVDVDIEIRDDSGDGILLAGEGAELGFSLSVDERFGGELKAVFASDDDAVGIDQPEIEFTTGFGGSSRRAYDTARHSHPGGLPRLRLPAEVEGVRDALLSMSVFRSDGGQGQWELLWQEPFTVEIVSARRPDLARVSLVEAEGNGDGRAQAGEVISLSVELELGTTDILRALDVRVAALDDDVTRLSTATLSFGAVDENLARSSYVPEFLLPADWQPGAELQFELAFGTGYEHWVDTVAVATATGPDETPPRVGDAFVAPTPQGLSIVLLGSRILDGSPIATATARVFALPDSDHVVAVALERYDDHYAGLWATDAIGPFTASVIVGDQAGNTGLSRGQRVRLRQSRVGPFPHGVDQVQADAPVMGLAFSTDGSVVAAAVGAQVRLYDPLTLRLLDVLPLPDKATTVAIGPWDQFLAAGAVDGTVTLWDLHGRIPRGQIGAAGYTADGPAEPGPAVNALAFGTNPPMLAIGYRDGTVGLWDAGADRPSFRNTLTLTDAGSITAMAFQPGADRLAIGQESGRILLWRVDRDAEQTLSAHDGPVRAVVYSEGGASIASAGSDRMVKLWVAQGSDFTLSRVFGDHDDAAEAVAFSRGSQILASAGLDGNTVLRQPDEIVRTLVAAEGGGLTSLVFSPDGTQLVSGSWNGTIQLMQVSGIETRRPLQVEPQDAVLLWAYPNPFNNGTVLSFRLLRQAAVGIEIFNVAGQLVRVLDGGERAAGMYADPADALHWDGRNEDGAAVAAGVYFAVLKAGNATLRQKLLLLK